jgi:hypothetical protein
MLVAGLKRVEERLDAVEARLDKMALKSELVALKTRVDGLQEQVRTLEERLGASLPARAAQPRSSPTTFRLYISGSPPAAGVLAGGELGGNRRRHPPQLAPRRDRREAEGVGEAR